MIDKEGTIGEVIDEVVKRIKKLDIARLIDRDIIRDYLKYECKRQHVRTAYSNESKIIDEVVEKLIRGF